MVVAFCAPWPYSEESNASMRGVCLMSSWNVFIPGKEESKVLKGNSE